MQVSCLQLKNRWFICSLPCITQTCLILLAQFFCLNTAFAQQETKIPKPPRIFTISGQVTFPDGRPATQALVKLITRTGVPRQAFTNDQGKFEFPGMDAGGYSLVASSLADPNFTSEPTETDTIFTATDTLNVRLTLRERSEGSTKPKFGLIAVAETNQRIPKEARKAFNQALKFKKDGETERALDSFNRSIELYPDYFQALSERGDLYISQRKLSEAATDFERALKIDAYYGPALRGSGYCKLENREFAEAIADLERSISAEPDNGGTYLLLGIAHLELDHREHAQEALQKALTFHALRAHIYLGNLYARQRLYQKAADELHAYLEAEPTASDAANLKDVEAQWRSHLPPK